MIRPGALALAALVAAAAASAQVPSGVAALLESRKALAAGQHDHARKQVDEVLAAAKEPALRAAALRQLARIEHTLARYGDAERRLREALALDAAGTGGGEAYRLLGELERKRDRNADAIAAFKNAFQALAAKFGDEDARLAPVLASLGAMKLREGDVKKAEELLTRARALEAKRAKLDPQEARKGERSVCARGAGEASAREVSNRSKAAHPRPPC